MPAPALEALLRDLGQGDEGEQVRVIRALGRCDAPQAVPALVAALQHPTARVHREAITVLARLGVAAAPALVTALQSGPIEASARVVEALARSSDPEVASTLLRALQIRDLAPESQERIADTLARIADPKAAPVLLEALKFRYLPLEAQYRIADALARIANLEAVSVLLEALKLRYLPPEALRRFADALARCGAPVVPSLVELLRGSDSGLRADAVEILIRMAEEHPTPALAAAVPELRQRLRLWAVEYVGTGPRIHVALEKIQALSFAGADLPLPATAPAVEPANLPIPSAEEAAGERLKG